MGALVATEGEPVTLGGGYTAEFQPADKVPAKETQVADLERALGYSIPERCLGNDVYGVWAVGGVLPSPQLTEDYTNPMGIPITFSYPSDWYADSVSQPAQAGSGLVIGAVISNVPTAMPSQDPSAPSPGPLPSDPNLPSDFVTITILGGTQQTSPALPDTPLPLSMRDAQPVPGVSNIRVLPARLGGMNVEIQVVAGPSASAADIATADAIVASIRMSDS